MVRNFTGTLGMESLCVECLSGNIAAFAVEAVVTVITHLHNKVIKEIQSTVCSDVRLASIPNCIYKY